MDNNGVVLAWWKSPRAKMAHLFISEDVSMGRVFPRSLCNAVVMGEKWNEVTENWNKIAEQLPLCPNCLHRSGWMYDLAKWLEYLGTE